jgi:iron complex transport system substrate-binding protein
MRRYAATGIGAGLVLAVCLAAGLALAATVPDLDGKPVTVPDAPKRVYAMSPPDTLLVYALDPCLLVGWNMPLPGSTQDWLPECAKGLPVLGGFFGQGRTPNKEALVAAKPDLVVSGTMAIPHREFEEFFLKLGTPVVHVQSDSPEAYPKALRFLGEVLDRRERGERLSAYAEKTLADIRRGVAGIPRDKRVTVYYAEGDDGLYTDGRGSFHTQVLDLAGAVNVHSAPQTRRVGLDKVTMETVIGYAPQVILTQKPACRDMILSSPLWRNMPAVKSGRVLLMPSQPFNWLDRPPSFMRLLGLKWMAHALYPEVFPYDMVKETREFAKLFLNRDLTDEQARALLADKTVATP